jgi:hypothetical protein
MAASDTIIPHTGSSSEIIMKTRRLLICSFISLAIGLSLLFGYCNGTAGMNAGYPISATSLNISITTTGYPALFGIPLTILGLLLLTISFIAAIVGEIRSRKRKSERKEPPPAETP